MELIIQGNEKYNNKKGVKNCICRVTHVGQSFLYSNITVTINYEAPFKTTSNQGAVIGIETIS